MDVDADRALDYAGAVLAVVVALSVALLIFGAFQAAGDTPEPPDARWSIERVNDTHASVEHVGSETIPSEDLSITIDGRVRPVPFSGTVYPGDTANLTVSPGSTVQVHWTGGGGTRNPMNSSTV